MNSEFLQMILENPLSLSIATLISEDLAYMYGLFAVQSEYMTSYRFIIFFCLGVVAGDLMLYGIGVLARTFFHKHLGSKVQSFLSKSLDENNDQEQFGLFEEFLVFTRFIPGTRLPTYIYCGYNLYSPIRFIVILAITCLVYTLFGVFIISMTSYTVGSDLNIGSRILLSILVAVFSISIFKFILLIRKLQNQYGFVINPLKRIILRLRHLEFWPSVLLYTPFSPFFLNLFIRYGGIKSLLSSNPAIKMSGLIGEKKTEIDLILKEHVNDKRLITLEVDESTTESTITDSGLKYPLFFKPDSGMKGTGVSLVKNHTEFLSKIKKTQKAHILQEYFDGKNEWGVFYYRFPESKKGQVYSLTLKNHPEVIGNGINTLYELIEKLPLFSQRFDWIFNECSYKPSFIPKDGEQVTLSVKGSHSKGCLFLDGSEYLDSQGLEHVCGALDKIPQFNVGRVDIKFRTLSDFEQGEFKIIEINGAGAESTNFYDPKFSKRQAFSIIYNQWKLIFKIGKLNKKLYGAPKNSLINLLKEITNFKKGT